MRQLSTKDHKRQSKHQKGHCMAFHKELYLTFLVFKFWYWTGLHFVARTSVSHGHILLFVTEQYYSNCPELPLVPPTSPYHSKLN